MKYLFFQFLARCTLPEQGQNKRRMCNLHCFFIYTVYLFIYFSPWVKIGVKKKKKHTTFYDKIVLSSLSVNNNDLKQAQSTLLTAVLSQTENCWEVSTAEEASKTTSCSVNYIYLVSTLGTPSTTRYNYSQEFRLPCCQVAVESRCYHLYSAPTF